MPFIKITNRNPPVAIFASISAKRTSYEKIRVKKISRATLSTKSEIQNSLHRHIKKIALILIASPPVSFWHDKKSRFDWKVCGASIIKTRASFRQIIAIFDLARRNVGEINLFHPADPIRDTAANYRGSSLICLWLHKFNDRYCFVSELSNVGRELNWYIA